MRVEPHLKLYEQAQIPPPSQGVFQSWEDTRRLLGVPALGIPYLGIHDRSQEAIDIIGKLVTRVAWGYMKGDSRNLVGSTSSNRTRKDIDACMLDQDASVPGQIE